MIYCEIHGGKATDTTGRCPDCPQTFVRPLDNLYMGEDSIENEQKASDEENAE